MLLPLASIDSSPLNPRTRFDGEDLQRLADSLQSDGLLHTDWREPRYIVTVPDRGYKFVPTVRTDMNVVAAS